MSDYFVENNKILALNGVLGRRNFLINCLYISLFKYLMLTPVIYAMFMNPELMRISSSSRPIWLLIYICLAGLIVSLLYFPSLVRRVRDILGEENDNRIFMISAIIAVIIFVSYAPIGTFLSLSWLGVFTVFLLLFWNGKITGEKPKSEIVKFNWGAFFGTWIWGLFNKTPITLPMLPLALTPASLPFMFICGLKGNEWAYNNNKDKYENVEKFHLTQSVQSIFLTIFSPIVTMILLIVVSMVSVSAFYGYSQKHPEIITKMETLLSEYQVKAVESTFDKIENDGKGYKFYLNPEDWNVASGVLKISVLKNAQSYGLIKNNRKYLKAIDLVDSIDIIKNVKIYSTFNNEILGEFSLSSEAEKQLKLYLEQKNITEFNDVWNSGYKLNTRPTLP